MDHFVIFPVNEDGIVLNPKLVGGALEDAMQPPFNFSDLFIYSHGWWTNGNNAMAEYGQYTIEFTKTFLSMQGVINPPSNSFGIGIHWPSTLSEDGDSAREVFQFASYYQMGSRANQVGANGLFATLRRALRVRQEISKTPIRLTLIGHSFGCRVVCKALQFLRKDMDNASTPPAYKTFVDNTQIRVILLQAAFKDDEFEAGGNYDRLIEIPNLKILVTTSQLDLAFNNVFPAAETANNIAHLQLHEAVALGAGGPTQATTHAYNAYTGGIPIKLQSGFAYAGVPVLGNERMLVADLTSLHAARIANGDYAKDGFSGSHSDISSPEIYNLIAGFAFQ
jgi:hypothetical protein